MSLVRPLCETADKLSALPPLQIGSETDLLWSLCACDKQALAMVRISSWADETTSLQEDKNSCDFFPMGFHYHTEQWRTCALWWIMLVSVQKDLSSPLSSLDPTSKASVCEFKSCECPLSLEVSKAKTPPTWPSAGDSPALSKRLDWRPAETPSHQHICNCYELA